MNPDAGNNPLDRVDRSPQGGCMKALQLQEAKQQFCAVADKAAHGKPYVVIVGVEEWRNAQPGKKSVLEALRACPADLTELDLSRRHRTQPDGARSRASLGKNC